MKKLLATTLALLMVFVTLTPTTTLAQQPIRVYVNGEYFEFPQGQPTEYNGTVVIPMQIFHALGFNNRAYFNEDLPRQGSNFTQVLYNGERVALVATVSVRNPNSQGAMRGVSIETLLEVLPSLGVAVYWEPETRVLRAYTAQGLLTDEERIEAAINAQLQHLQEFGTPCPINTESPSDFLDHTPENIALMEQGIFLMINQHRINNDLTPLIWSDILHQASQAHSQDLIDNNLPIGHRGSDGSRSMDRVRRIAPQSNNGPGENISGAGGGRFSLGTARRAFRDWYNSAGHNINMLTMRQNLPGLTHAGIGIAVGEDGRTIVTLKISNL